MTLEEIRRAFSKPPAEYPKRLDNSGEYPKCVDSKEDPCPWCGATTQYRYLNESGTASGWKCPGCKREGYFSVPYQIDPLKTPREDPVVKDDPCPQCGNPVRNIWTLPNLTRGGDEWWCQHCRAQGRYQDIPF